MLDAAAFVSHDKLDLSRYHPAFVTLSFYKMFGFPMGVGALLIRKDVIPLLKPIYFGGGTVFSSLPDRDFHIFFSGESKFEAGTIPIQSIASLPFGFDMIKRKGGPEAIRDKTVKLAQRLADKLLASRYGNGQHVFSVYGNYNGDRSHQGPIVTFNIAKENGEFYHTNIVNAYLRDNNINIRTGCMCNPGSCLSAVGIDFDSYQQETTALASGVEMDSNSCLDVMISKKEAGAIRVSLGHATTLDDINRLIVALDKYIRKQAAQFEGLETLN